MQKSKFFLSLFLFLFLAGEARADVPSFEMEDRLEHESLDLHPAVLPLDSPFSRVPLDNFQKTMAIVAVCSVVISAISLGYRISQDQKKDPMPESRN